MSFQKTKIDKTLGENISRHLISKGIETPQKEYIAESLESKIDYIEVNFREIMKTLGLDLSDDSLQDTPKRIAKMFVLENFWGLDPANFPKITVIDNKMRYDEMVCERNIKVMSVCEHHFVPIDGYATIAYIPNGDVIGLSKLNRIVEYFSRRPQVQERLTMQIAESLMYILNTKDVAVLINAKHYCVVSRGVEDQNADTTTSYLGGEFKNDGRVRQEFFSIANRG